MSTFDIGLCDRCGFQYRLNELRQEYVDRKPSGLRVCPECYDIDHEQYRVSEVITDDPTPPEDPRPDVGLEDQRKMSGWNPVGGNNYSTQMRVFLGKVTVTTT